MEKYGEIKFFGMRFGVHQFSYKLANSLPMDEKLNLYVLHRCDVRACVNPAHLYLGAAKDNTKDMFERKRNPPLSEKFLRNKYRKGHRPANTKLNELQVKIIKILFIDKVPIKFIADLFSVSNSTIKSIKENRTWSKIVVDSYL